MDVTPPPAVVSSAQQEAIDALSRLASTQAWLSAQQQALPSLPAWPSAEGRDAWLVSLDIFWQRPVPGTPGAPLTPRIDVLATRLASTMRDDAILQRIDGTLDASASALAERFARSPAGMPPPGVEARSLRIGAVDYAGAVIVLDRANPARVLRFMPDSGWHVFDGLEQLHAETEVRLRETLARQRDLPGVPADDTEQVIARERFVGSQPLEGDVFGVLARRAAAVQREKLEDVWPASGDADASSRFTDDAASALDLHEKIDVFAMLAEREGRLAAALSEQRLARVPTDVARNWRDAMEGYRLAWLLAASSARQHDGGAPLTLAAWSRRELAAALTRRRIALDPDDIRIEATGSEGLSLPGIGTKSSHVTTQMSLAEFALHNSGYYDGRRLHVIPVGVPPDTPLPRIQTLSEMTRELNLAPRFDTYLRERVSDPQGRAFRRASMRLQQARMRVEAATARMSTFLPDEHASFVDDREERGYRMVEAVLDSPVATGRREVGGHRIAVRQLVYRDAVVSDVLLIGVRDTRSSSRIILYTPGAPDGRYFREFSDRATAAREFLYGPAFEEYLLRRLPAELGEPLPGGGGRRFRVSEATRRAGWVLSAPGDGRGTITEMPFSERLIDGDIRTAQFDAEIVRQARDVAWVGRSTTQADVEAIVGIVGGVLNGVRGPANLLEDSLSAVGQALRATWRFYDSVKARDATQAFVDFTEAYTSSLSLAGWHNLLGRSTRTRLSLRSGGDALRRADAGIRLPDMRQSLDSRYAVSNIDLTGMRPDASGIHVLNGRRYIRQHELVFELRRDRTYGTWRLARPHAMDAAFPGPAVEATNTGGWRVRNDIGLRGGWVDNAVFRQARTRGVSGQELEGLSDFQHWTFQQSLGNRLHNGGEASRIYWQVTSQPLPRFVTLRQRTAWNDALRTARNTPAEPIAVGSQPAPGAPWRVLPMSEWPTHLWHYPETAGLVAERGRSLVLPLQALPGSGLVGLPVSTRAPMQASSPPWIRLHLDQYRGRHGNVASPGLRIIEDRRGPVPVYVVQPAVGFPISFLGLEPGDFSVGGLVGP
jgi:hypothetical protein